jgi:hypothetical protein
VTANDALLPRDNGAAAEPRRDRVDALGAAASRPSQSWLTRKGAERMVALGKLLRTTAFRLTLVYLVVFALFAAFLLAYFAWNTRRLITEQITETVEAEVQRRRVFQAK